MTNIKKIVALLLCVVMTLGFTACRTENESAVVYKTESGREVAIRSALYILFQIDADADYKEEYDEAYIDSLLDALKTNGAKNIILTGVGYDKDSTGVVVLENGVKSYYKHKRIVRGCHGTGDVYASAFVGLLLKGYKAFDAAKAAADFTVKCIENTADDKEHWYGVKFETALSELIK